MKQTHIQHFSKIEISYYCDICEQPIKTYRNKNPVCCSVCGKHLCNLHKYSLHLEMGCRKATEPGAGDENLVTYNLKLCPEHFELHKDALNTLFELLKP